MSKATGADLIAVERKRQMDSEGWTPEHDDEYSHAELVRAALSYGEVSIEQIYPHFPDRLEDDWFTRTDWPWATYWWKPDCSDPVRNLVKAGALIAAEIDRLQRKKEKKEL